MADPRPAILRTIQNEVDPHHPDAVTIDNNGYKVKYGINAQDNPDLFDANHPDGPTMDEAVLRYTSVYWPMAFASLNSEHIAEQIFDLSVNTGKYHAAKILQQAISACGATVTIDGVIGNETVAAANSCNEAELVAAIVPQAKNYYQQIVNTHPEDAKYLQEWIHRAENEAAG